MRRLDWVLVGAVAVLCVLGCALVWAATKPQGLSSSYLKKDVLNIILGLGLAVVAASVDYRTLRAYTPVLYVASVLGLLAVLSPLGSADQRRALVDLVRCGFELQPSEFAKVAVILGMAMLLSEKREGSSEPSTQDILYSLGIAAVPVLLILAQPDVGSIMVFAFIIFGMLTLSGISAKWVVGMLVVARWGAVDRPSAVAAEVPGRAAHRFTQPERRRENLRPQPATGAYRDQSRRRSSGRGSGTAR